MFSSRLEFKGAIVGMVMGDASLSKHINGKNYFLVCAHSPKQKEYLLHKKSLLEDLTACRFYENFNSTGNTRGKFYCRVDTLTNPFYTKLHEHMYYQGKKTINEHVLKCLTPMGLSLWYQDDGSVHQCESPGALIHTNAFNQTENEQICRILQKRFGLQFRLRKAGKYYEIRLREKDLQTFIDLVTPFMHETMKYKLDFTPYKKRAESEANALRNDLNPMVT